MSSRGPSFTHITDTWYILPKHLYFEDILYKINFAWCSSAADSGGASAQGSFLTSGAEFVTVQVSFRHSAFFPHCKDTWIGRIISLWIAPSAWMGGRIWRRRWECGKNCLKGDQQKWMFKGWCDLSWSERSISMLCDWLTFILNVHFANKMASLNQNLK